MSTTLLLTHLQNPNTNVPLDTLVGALVHHLSVDLPTPTPLAAAAISSPYFLVTSPTNERLQALVTAFRHAVHLKHQALSKAAENGWSVSQAVFSKGVERGTKEWIRAVIRGLQGGRAVLRLACCTGLLLGIKGLPQAGMGDGKVEDEVVISLAEVMDDYNADTGDWEKEFRPKLDASQSLPSIPKAKLKALPLSLLAGFLTSTIASAFHEGMFLKEPVLGKTIQTMSSAPTMLALAGLSKLTALTLGILIESSTGGLLDAHSALQIFQTIATRIEQDWRGSKFASVRDEEEISPDIRETYKSVWLLLKTLLFSTIMVADSVLGAAIYVPPRAPLALSSHVLAKSILRTLSHLSFVVSQFGGVTGTAVSDDPGFMELRKVFYLALDTLSAQEPPGERYVNHCESFVKELVTDLGGNIFVPGNLSHRSGSFAQAKTAYTLACIEQLVPSLGVPCLRDEIWCLCTPYLSDPSHRETYESAHSVVLSIFSSHAEERHAGNILDSGVAPVSGRRLIVSEAEHESRLYTQAVHLDSATFVQRMVPYYAQCLIENSLDGQLSTAQLRLAYAALVGCASSSGANAEARQLGWYCINLIVDVIRGLSSEETEGDSLERSSQQRLHRLHLTLISTVSSLPLSLMIRALEEIRSIITIRRQSDSGVERVKDGVEEERRRKELVDALFVEISERVGDQEKEAAMRWWYMHRKNFIEDDTKKAGMTGEEQPGLDVVSRL
ncbi:hypothetical protein DXG01_008754 [Tephrocybe rancida]|nr:hypothetical protein DXG01_008754 [Tephrocybe rancida]